MGAVYFDHNATTPLDPRAREAMLPWLGERHGNPSSVHSFGQAAREAVEAARQEVASLLEARPQEVVFTASGTEANNAVVFSQARRAGFRGHLAISGLEHPSVRAAAVRVEEAGAEVSRIRPGGDGTIDPEELVGALREDTFLVCLMQASNEIGTLQPVAEVAEACRERGVPVLCDAVQGVGKVPVRPAELGVDFLTLGAHKFYGPLGAAALWVRPGAGLRPLLAGGSQERRRRAGTENVPALVGMGVAARLAREELGRRRRHLAALRDRFEAGLGVIGEVIVHGAAAPRLPNTSHAAFSGVDGEALMVRLDLAGFAVSTGAACASGVVEPSATLKAMGVPDREALSSLRLSFGITNTVDEVDALLEVLAREVEELRRLKAAASG